MEFAVKTYHFDRSNYKTDWDVCRPLRLEGWEVEPVDLPQVKHDESAPSYLVTTTHEHDGTLLFTYAAIAAVTKEAEHQIAKNPKLAMTRMGMHAESNVPVNICGGVYPGRRESVCLILQELN